MWKFPLQESVVHPPHYVYAAAQNCTLVARNWQFDELRDHKIPTVFAPCLLLLFTDTYCMTFCVISCKFAMHKRIPWTGQPQVAMHSDIAMYIKFYWNIPVALQTRLNPNDPLDCALNLCKFAMHNKHSLNRTNRSASTCDKVLIIETGSP